MEAMDDKSLMTLLVGFVGRHLAWVIAAVAVGYAGYTSGLTRIADLEQRAERSEQLLKKDRKLLNCIALNIRLIEAGAKADADCSMEVPE